MALNYLYRTLGKLRGQGGLPSVRTMSTHEQLYQKVKHEEDALRRNPYFKKYEEKFESLKQERPEDYVTRLKTTEKTRTLGEIASSPQPQPGETTVPTYSKMTTKSELKPCKSLEDIVKLDLLEDKSAPEITHIWREFHKNLDGLTSVLNADVYKTFQSRGKQYPIFLLPLPRKEGYEFFVCQLDKTEVNFTQLVAWQEKKETALVCMSLVYYPDLVESKGLALMRGSYDKKVLSLLEAQCLANCLHLYYAEDNERRTALLERFTHDPESFRHMDLIAEVESLGIN